MKNYLFEAQIAAKRGKKQAAVNVTPEEQIRRMIDVRVGEFSAEIPESALDTVIAFIRELLKADMNTSAVIDLILTQVKESGRTPAEVEKIRSILNAIDKKFDPDFINKIPATFPFLAAVGKDAYQLSDLDADSLTLLNFHKKKIGRGEVAIPLLFGIDKFANDEDEQKGTNSYDLVYDGKKADIKDYRTDTGGKLKDTKELRLGEPASDAFNEKANAGFQGSAVGFVKNLQAEDFISQQTGADKLIELFKEDLNDVSLGKLKLMTKSDVKKEINDAIAEIVRILDDAVHDTIEEKYPGGFFTITEKEIKIVLSTGFVFNRFPGAKRLTVSPSSDVNASNFSKGLLQQVTARLDDVYALIEEKSGKEIESGTIDDIVKKVQAADQESESSNDQQQEIVESLLRRLIRSI